MDETGPFPEPPNPPPRVPPIRPATVIEAFRVVTAWLDALPDDASRRRVLLATMVLCLATEDDVDATNRFLANRGGGG
jgi:hypothetical protein